MIPLLIKEFNQGNIVSKSGTNSFRITSRAVITEAAIAENFAEFFPFSDWNQNPLGSTFSFMYGKYASEKTIASGIKNAATNG